MKDFWIILVIVAMIVAGSKCSQKLYQTLYDSYTVTLENLVIQIETDEEKETTIAQIEKDWQEKETLLIILQDHASMDKIEENLYECFHYYRFGDKEKLILSKDKVLSSMEDLIKREELLLVDIL